MNNEKLFDQLIKDKLEAMSIVQPDYAWNKFSRANKMNAAREGHFFDQAVSRSLSDVSTPIAGNEWHEFKAHWDNYAHQVEHQFDSQIRSGIQSNRLAPDSKAFDILESALAQSNIRNKNLIPSKIIEAVLMSVIILLLYMYTPLLQPKKSDQQTKEIQTNQPANPQQFDRAFNSSKEAEREVVLSEISSNSRHIKGDDITPSQTSSSINNRERTVLLTNSNADKSLSANSASVSELQAVEVFSKYTFTHNKDKSEDVNSIFSRKANNNVDMSSSIEKEDFQGGSGLLQSYTLTEFSKLNKNDISPKSIFSGENYPNYKSIPIKLTAGKNLLSAVWLGLRIGRAFDMIKTPSYSESAKLFSAQRVQSTILAFNVEVKNDFVNVETGVSYSKKTFGPEGQNNETAHFINIPLSIKKDFFPSNKFVPYFKVGPDITIVAAASYANIAKSNSNLAKGDKLAPLYGYASNIDDGVIHSGSLSTNSFLGIHGSLGFEAKINNFSKLTFEVAQQINPFEKGIGINNHRFSETSVSIGFKRLLFENLY